MFNAEKLLGKIMQETLGGGSSGRSNKGGGMLDSLASGQGLMTVLGLGIGAYEILKGQQTEGMPNPPSGQAPPSIPAGSGERKAAPPPPPPPGGAQSASPPPPPPAPAPETQANDNIQGQELALRLIRVMIAAAHADGHLDKAEEKAILDRLQGAELESEEKMFLIQELHQPKKLAELTAGIHDPAQAQMIYVMAVAAIEVDTAAERDWLDELGTRLGLSEEIRNFIEKQG